MTNSGNALADAISPYFQDNYIRDTTGSNEGGQFFSDIYNVTTVPYTLVVNRQQIAGDNGTLTLQTTNNYIEVTKIR